MEAGEDARLDDPVELVVDGSRCCVSSVVSGEVVTGFWGHWRSERMI